MLQRRGDGSVVELCIDDPPTRNALGLDVLEVLADALDGIAADRSTRVVVLSATGPVFSSGAHRADLADEGRVRRSAELLRRIVERIAGMDQTVVCRAQGDAYGGGVALIGAADLTVAASDAHFSFPEPRFGLVATIAAGTCVRRLGLTAALDLLLTGRRFDAVEAARLGLIAAAVDGSDLDNAVARRVDALLEGAPSAVATTKRIARTLAHGWPTPDLDVADDLGLALSLDEAREGAAALAAKRPAAWVATWTSPQEVTQ
jgi:methylglutaconyl-CoA hydratase